MFGEEMPDDCDSMSAKRTEMIIYSCPICKDKIELSEENKFYTTCSCGYRWRPSLFGVNANVPIKELIDLKYGIWKDYKEE